MWWTGWFAIGLDYNVYFLYAVEWVWPVVVWTLDSDAASLYCLLLFVCCATI